MKRFEDIHSELGETTATIANGVALSGAIDLGGMHLVGIIMPAAWTAAAITLQASLDGNTFYDVYDDAGTEISFTVAASRWVRLEPAYFAGFNHVKLRSGTTGTPVNQGAERSLTVVGRVI